MIEKSVLTPHEADAVVENRIEFFGLGVLPRVTVTELADGTWRVQWVDSSASSLRWRRRHSTRSLKGTWAP
jgi:hypothetical protein